MTAHRAERWARTPSVTERLSAVHGNARPEKTETLRSQKGNPPPEAAGADEQRLTQGTEASTD
jgi:hypothetical protein